MFNSWDSVSYQCADSCLLVCLYNNFEMQFNMIFVIATLALVVNAVPMDKGAMKAGMHMNLV